MSFDLEEKNKEEELEETRESGDFEQPKESEESEESEEEEEGDEYDSDEAVLRGADPALLREMVEIGLFYGKKKARTFPGMKKYILTTRNGVEILDLVQTISAVEKAKEFLQEITKAGGKVLLVGTQPAAKEEIRRVAKKYGFPYVTEKWVGGALTNFGVIRKRIEKYTKMKEDKEAGRFSKYSKKEQSKMNRELEKMEFLFSGIESMNKLPEAVLIINPTFHETALREAKAIKAPVVSVLSSDSNPEEIDYVIPANDNAKKSISFVMGKLEEGMEKSGTASE